jgi:hypothetical protein
VATVVLALASGVSWEVAHFSADLSAGAAAAFLSISTSVGVIGSCLCAACPTFFQLSGVQADTVCQSIIGDVCGATVAITMFGRQLPLR